ncbi:ABC transporter substrate-binding protein [Labrys miyagiensis]|uniref:ABC transporter substrate-binding protein n=1 Tax=Labrys miyagiensis TaxID=346912 RepID=A0ABQ6CB88_9HYPH|nr:extracellular solute-binding protein [Labrys miyagiensis]GLS17454.1 ABC transporter substrate-binding protein [Labrys miyagiensis]
MPQAEAFSHPTRRTVLKAGFLGAAAALLPAGVRGEEVESHGLSLFGDLKYGPDFKAFFYVRPDAPKGGTFSQQVVQTIYNQNLFTFDNLNIYILKGAGAAGIDMCFATLFSRAWDEMDAMYAYAAQTVQVSADRLTYRFRLRPGLTFHDGSPLTAEDCAWSFTRLKEDGHPYITEPLRFMKEAVAEAPDLVRVTLTPERGRTTPLTVAGLPIFAKAWWTGKDFTKTTLEPILGSGPYKIGRIQAGQSISFERVKDWWGEKLPSQVGSNNFDNQTYVYYQDRAASFIAFSTKNFLFREEYTSLNWATGYDIPPVRDGRIKRETVPDHTASGGQGWLFNTRRPQLADPRVRQAIGMAFDFEWTNKHVMYSLYQRATSIFENSSFKATGKPSPEELAMLEPYRGKVPDAVFGEAIVPPVSDGSGFDRNLLRAAGRMLAEAGWTIDNRILKNAKGEPFTIEFLEDDDGLYKHTAPFIQNLQRLGIQATFRVVDPSQMQIRTDNFDFDVITQRVSYNSTPADDMRGYYASANANRKGTLNRSGVADPVLDALMDRMGNAGSREELVAACRCFDRVLRAGFYWVPMWYRTERWLAYWDEFEHGDPGAIYELGAMDLWWAKPKT